jgi:hypothetical protein
VIIAGLHCARILRYNGVLDELESFDMKAFPAARGADLANRYAQFLIARQVTLWHYQWLLVNEHLPQIAGQTAVNDVLRNGNRFYKPSAGDAFVPIEFDAAAYRFGHSMVRPSYRANFTSGTDDSDDPTKDRSSGSCSTQASRRLKHVLALPAVPRHRPQARAEPEPEHHRQPRLHPRALPVLRRRGRARNLPLKADRITSARRRPGMPARPGP